MKPDLVYCVSIEAFSCGSYREPFAAFSIAFWEDEAAPMRNRVFCIGESVRIELIPAGDDENVAVPSGKSFLSVDLLNFTGCLHVTFSVTDPLTGASIALRGNELSTSRLEPSEDRTSAEVIVDAVIFEQEPVAGVRESRAQAEDDAVPIDPPEQLREEASFSYVSTTNDTHPTSTLQGEGVLVPADVTQSHSDENDPLASTTHLLTPIQEEMASRVDTTTERDILKSKWGSILTTEKVRTDIPKKFKERRSYRKQSPTDPLPTKLHTLCAKKSVTMEELHTAFLDEPDTVSIQDLNGCLPLHIIADNDALLEGIRGREIATTFCLQLMKAYPEGVTTKNNEGYMPFVPMLQDWMEWVYEQVGKKKQSKAFQLIDRVVSHGISSMTRTRDESHNESETEQGMQRGMQRSLSSRSLRFFPRVELWEEAEWCFTMLSMAMDEFGGRSGGLYQREHNNILGLFVEDRAARAVLVKHVVEKLPSLLKTILLIEEEGGDTRRRLLNMSLIRRILLCPESVGPWLIGMLRKSGVPSKRALEYLEVVSQTTITDSIGGFQSAQTDDIKAFNEQRHSVFDAFEGLEGTIASLVVLDESAKERAASTQVVWYTMNKKLQRPITVGLLLIDLALHMTLLLAFRNEVQFEGGDGSAIGAVPTQAVVFICCHYIIRKTCEGLALLSVSKTVFRRYFTSIWTVLDVGTIIVTMGAIEWNYHHPNVYQQGLNSFVIGLLWMKVLGFLKVVNEQMSTFILALFEILSGIRYFGVVLFVIIVMFGDMLHIALSTKDNGDFCNLNADNLSEPAEDFCSPKIHESYLRVYSLLLGNFDLNDYRESEGMTILFVMFTLLGVVILLNVLIAVIGDTYREATIASRRRFGRSRIIFVAQHEALERFLRPELDASEHTNAWNSPRGLLHTANHVGRWFVLISLIATAMNAEVYLVLRAVSLIGKGKDYLIIIGISVLAVVLTVALWIILCFSLENLIRNYAPDRVVHIFAVIDNFTVRHTGVIGTRLFGLKENGDIGEADEEWAGRLLHMEEMFDRTMTNAENMFERTVSDAKEELSGELMAFEKRLYENQARRDGRSGSTNGTEL